MPIVAKMGAFSFPRNLLTKLFQSTIIDDMSKLKDWDGLIELGAGGYWTACPRHKR